MGSCQLPLRETHSGGQPWTPPNHWPTDAFWLIISISLDSVLWPHVSQALCGLVCLCESIIVLLYWLSQLSQFKKKWKKKNLWGTWVHSPIERRVEAFYNDEPRSANWVQEFEQELDIAHTQSSKLIELLPLIPLQSVKPNVYISICTDWHFLHYFVTYIFFHSGNLIR